MEPVILVIHLFLALGIIALVLLQRSEGGGLGMGGGGLGGFSTARSTANALTKATAFLAAGFFITSLTLGVMAGGHSNANKGILNNVAAKDIEVPASEAAGGIQYTPPSELMGNESNAPIDIEAVPEENAPKADAAATEQPSTATQPVEQPKPVAPVAE
jgi:preprotein translocase subunit SecG